jgi:hypothetical protein
MLYNNNTIKIKYYTFRKSDRGKGGKKDGKGKKTQEIAG